jgi:hypothetical protein
MNIIIPVYPENGDEEKLLGLEIQHVPIAFSAVENLRHISGANIHVFTTTDFPLDYSSYPGVHHHRHDKIGISMGLFRHLPVGAYECVLSCCQSFGKDDIIVIVDYRNPCIKPDFIQKAVESYLQDTERTLVSVSLPEDNPVQFNAYYRLIDMDVVCLVDKDEHPEDPISGKSEGDNLFITKPGPFDWGSFNGIFDEKRGIYIGFPPHEEGVEEIGRAHV